MPWHPDTFTSAWRKLAVRLKLTLRFHDLRHSHAAQLLRLRIHAKIVSERLGHSTVGLTLDTYFHVLGFELRCRRTGATLTFRSCDAIFPPFDCKLCLIVGTRVRSLGGRHHGSFRRGEEGSGRA